LPQGYDLCCRTVGGSGTQLLPRTFSRTGFNAIHRVVLSVKA
jgi:hypothetical protein